MHLIGLATVGAMRFFAYGFAVRIFYYKEKKVRKFQIPTIPLTTSKSIRFPNDVIENVEKTIQGKNCTFTAFVVEAVKYVLENVDI